MHIKNLPLLLVKLATAKLGVNKTMSRYYKSNIIPPPCRGRDREGVETKHEHNKNLPPSQPSPCKEEGVKPLAVFNFALMTAVMVKPNGVPGIAGVN